MTEAIQPFISDESLASDHTADFTLTLINRAIQSLWQGFRV
jgi:hypothetical protein